MAAANPALRLGVERVPADAADRGQAPESLALLYQGLFTGIVRLQSRRQQLPDAGAFRRRTMGTLQEIERAARSSGYDGRDVMDGMVGLGRQGEGADPGAEADEPPDDVPAEKAGAE